MGFTLLPEKRAIFVSFFLTKLMAGKRGANDDLAPFNAKLGLFKPGAREKFKPRC